MAAKKNFSQISVKLGTAYIESVLEVFSQKDAKEDWSRIYPHEDIITVFRHFHKKLGSKPFSEGISYSSMYSWYLQTTSALAKRNEVCDKLCLKAWLKVNSETGASQFQVKTRVKTTSLADQPLKSSKVAQKDDSEVALFQIPKCRIFHTEGKNGYQAEPVKFHLINFDSSDITFNLMKFAKALILENGGELVLEENLNDLENLDAIVINFGPLNKEVYSFLENHQQDLYSPSLVFEAIGRESFIRDERLISVDRLLNATGKQQKQWKDFVRLNPIQEEIFLEATHTRAEEAEFPNILSSRSDNLGKFDLTLIPVEGLTEKCCAQLVDKWTETDVINQLNTSEENDAAVAITGDGNYRTASKQVKIGTLEFRLEVECPNEIVAQAVQKTNFDEANFCRYFATCSILRDMMAGKTAAESVNFFKESFKAYKPDKSNYKTVGDIKKEIRRLFSQDQKGKRQYSLAREQFTEFPEPILDSLLHFCEPEKDSKLGPQRAEKEEK